MSLVINRYWHTLRHLRPIQFYGRLWFKLYRPRPDLRPRPKLRNPNGVWRLPARREPSLFGPDEFQFLGQSGALAEIGWDGPQREKLWRYNQHYFDDLNAMRANSRMDWHKSLLKDWVDQNPAAQGNGWEPYPTSLRIVNWVKWALAGNELPEACRQSLAVQARWLARRLEIHLLGNHLFANSKALVFAGFYFDGPEAENWLRTGLRILQREVPEQVLDDGGHFERSTMYHALILEDMLDLCNVAACFECALLPPQREQVKDWHARASAMLGWLHSMCHPDSAISFFNDTAFGIAPSVAELDAYAERLGIPVIPARLGITWLKQSGYARLSKGEAVALLDMAPVGPDYLPGHAHADTLSFELSLFGQRVLVNSGTSCYGNGAERLRQRKTPAHNTVAVDDEDSSEVWGGFRVARRARPVEPEVREDCELSASCAHDGYRRLPDHPVHRRSWVLGNGFLTVTDSVTGTHRLAEGRYHFHPTVSIEPGPTCRDGRGFLPDGRSFSWLIEEGEGRIEPATWHPRFGVIEPNLCIVLRLIQGSGRMRFSWD